eukprot:scaffold166299_cov32-Tisochrysis_lutea.AAC.3
MSHDAMAVERSPPRPVFQLGHSALPMWRQWFLALTRAARSSLELEHPAESSRAPSRPYPGGAQQATTAACARQSAIATRIAILYSQVKIFITFARTHIRGGGDWRLG